MKVILPPHMMPTGHERVANRAARYHGKIGFLCILLNCVSISFVQVICIPMPSRKTSNPVHDNQSLTGHYVCWHDYDYEISLK